MSMVIFYNYSSVKFTCTWDKIPYSFEPQRVYSGVLIADNGMNSITLTDSIARVFAHHLACFVMNNNKEWSSDRQKYTYGTMDLLEQRALSMPDVEVPTPPGMDEIAVLPIKMGNNRNRKKRKRKRLLFHKRRNRSQRDVDVHLEYRKCKLKNHQRVKNLLVSNLCDFSHGKKQKAANNKLMRVSVQKMKRHKRL